MVYDAETDNFILGTTDHKMLVLDKDGGVIATIPVKGPVDEAVVYESARRAYVGGKAGLIEVIDPDNNKVVDTPPSEKSVHTPIVDPKTHNVYVYRNESNKVDVFRKTS